MENSVITRKWSDIQGIAVVDLSTGKKVGSIEDFYFEPTSNAIRGLLIKTGLLSRRVLLSSAINAIGLDAVTFNDESTLVKEHDEQLAGAAAGRGLFAYRVLSEGGNVVGTIGNVIINISTPSATVVEAFELSGGILERFNKRVASFSAKQVARYGHDVLVIPDEVAQSLR
jgi:uncharacterized protein YrrD